MYNGYNLKPRTGWRLITPPTSEVLDLTAVKQQLNRMDTVDDVYIQSLIPVAREYIEARNRILAPQTWEMVLDGIPGEGQITIWKNPVQSVDFIQYADSDGVMQTWDAAAYQLSTTSAPARILLAPNASWPTVRAQSESLVVRVRAGYTGSPVSIPALLMQSMRMLIAHLYEHREAVIDGGVTLLPVGLEDFIDAAIGQARVY